LAVAEPAKTVLLCRRVSVRPQLEDLQLMRERAKAQHLSMSACAARIVGGHVRARLPKTTPEPDALKAGTAEVSTVGRKLNRHIARASNRGERTERPHFGDLKLLLRDRVRAVMEVNTRSWLCTDHSHR
jgi:hypothetical protein